MRSCGIYDIVYKVFVDGSNKYKFNHIIGL